MARRRSMRNNPRKFADISSSSRSSSLEPVHSPGMIGESCPGCSADAQSLNVFEKVSWIRCDVCKMWYHWKCVGNGEDVDAIDKWYCNVCLDADLTRSITLKAPARKSSRKKVHRDYASLNSGSGSDPTRWTRMLEGKVIQGDIFQRIDGRELNLAWLEDNDGAMSEPLVIEKPEGLGMKMPPNDLTVHDIAELVGEDTPIEVIDVASQSTAPGWTLGKWVEYFNLDQGRREKIFNVISLEVSGSKLSDMILPPKFVRDLDWVENFWPNTRKGKGHSYPKVQLYCLMGVSKAWTDWHIDFAGSSVYYHILQGSKVFYFIRPTPGNLAAYEQWSGTELQYQTWLGDMVDKVYMVELHAGNTMIIPTGWIHAVYTPVDTLVFGGNFLHSYNVSTQLQIRNIEIATQVPKKFRFPMFSKLCWYVGDKFLRELKSHTTTSLSSRVMSSIIALADFLVSEARILEQGTEQGKKEVRDQIPTDRVKDASAMARELRWRARSAGGYSSEDDNKGYRYLKEMGSGYYANGVKRKRSRNDSVGTEDGFHQFKNFRPKTWDATDKTVGSKDVVSRRREKPGEDKSWTEMWLDDGDSDLVLEEKNGIALASVESHREVIFKVRRTAQGIERHRIERQIERWHWSD